MTLGIRVYSVTLFSEHLRGLQEIYDFLNSRQKEWTAAGTQVPTTVLIPLRIAGRLSLMNYEILRQK